MSYRPTYSKGDWKAVCDSCGRVVKASSLIRRWDGLMVCDRDYETRHPQDFVRGVADFQAPLWARPETADTFVVDFPTTITEVEALGITEYLVYNRAIGGFTDTLGIAEDVLFSKALTLSDSLLIAEAVLIPRVGYAINSYALNSIRIN